jgi:hypothetical protein
LRASWAATRSASAAAALFSDAVTQGRIASPTADLVELFVFVGLDAGMHPIHHDALQGMPRWDI